MSRQRPTDAKSVAAAPAAQGARAPEGKPMTAFVESCVETVADSAIVAERRSRKRPRFRKLLRLLHGKRNILVSTHRYPDPDALASGWALTHLLRIMLPEAVVSFSVSGTIGGGINEPFVRTTNLKLTPWDDAALPNFDAIILTDVQPTVSASPLPAGVTPLGVIDHHRVPGHPRCPFCDIRTDVGATSSIVFSYYMETEQSIDADLAAALLYGIESDLAGAAGQPGTLDNIALSSLTLLANPRKLYQMRYVDLPRSYYVSYASGLANAVYYGNAIVSHLSDIDSPEKPAVIADFLLRFDQVQWAMVTAVYARRLVVSLRTSDPKLSAAEMMRRLLRGIGEGGGHRTKAGGFIALKTDTQAEIDHLRRQLRQRYLRALHIHRQPGTPLVPPQPTATAGTASAQRATT